MDKKSDNNKKYFNSKEYSSMVIGKDDLLSRFTNSSERDAREDVLRLIKKEPGALDLLIAAIQDKKLDKHKADFIAACWESGIDCRSQLNYFVKLAISSDYLCCIEAYSVVCGMDTPVDQTELEKSISELEKEIQGPGNDKIALLKQLLDILDVLERIVYLSYVGGCPPLPPPAPPQKGAVNGDDFACAQGTGPGYVSFGGSLGKIGDTFPGMIGD